MNGGCCCASVHFPVRPRASGDPGDKFARRASENWIPARAGMNGGCGCASFHFPVRPRASGDPGDQFARPASGNWIPACAGMNGGCCCASVHFPVRPRASGDPGDKFARRASGNWIPARAGMSERCGTTGILTHRPQLRPHLREHALDLGLYRCEFAGIARTNNDVGIRPVLLVDERIAADDCLGMCLGNSA
jgi:hypothetical protein